MNFKEFAVGTEHETHTLTAGYFTAKIRKGKYIYYIDCADTFPYSIARIDLQKEPLTATTLEQAKYKVAQIYKQYLEANAKKQAELSKLWCQMNKQARQRKNGEFSA
ncbi:MAG: hypothetical protein SPH77_03055 [Campylobacter sp.]|uniref:hypothetical protein n=1 Tax=Campylobacter sp. TaxID=205 RepID=UPI002A90DBA1|nr:hypothetical protein [Campylobacter sp.]MCI7501346.1 hypothetical protein [Campylobacter sp.]MDY6187796.1 hypothetical protein [Campylobacter sp.]